MSGRARVAPANPVIINAGIISKVLIVEFADGRELQVPLSWFPRLEAASASARMDLRILPHGVGIHWPQIDEDLSARGLLIS